MSVQHLATSPAGSASSPARGKSPPDAGGYRLSDKEFRNKRSAAIVFLCITFLGFGGAIVINEIQGIQLGAGTGFHDTHVLSPTAAQNFFETHPVTHP
jgi:hypothetical protein